ncbi:MAG TPA: zf-HC2 domain-containing protein [Candidatus Dietzia intestinipullorum]|nr:zf-HC2 domain-containing protein [Candidatus Dietzia intestinipullorum]
MNRHRPEPDPAREYRLSPEVADEVSERTGRPAPPNHFLSTDHLSTEAAAAYVDGRLPAAGQARADAHLARCPDCRSEVADQREVRHTLRGSGPIQMPRDLRERLRSIADSPPPEPPVPPRQDSAWARLVRRLRGDDR